MSSYSDAFHAECLRIAAERPCEYVKGEGPHAPGRCLTHREPMAVVGEFCRGVVDEAYVNLRTAS